MNTCSRSGVAGARSAHALPCWADRPKCRRRADCALLDINLNGDMVFPVADVLAERAVPFVFLTGYGQDVIPARHANVPRYEKPFKHAALMQGLSHVLVRASAAQ